MMSIGRRRRALTPSISALAVARRCPVGVPIALAAVAACSGLDIVWARPNALAPVVLAAVLGASGLAASVLLDDDRPFFGGFVAFTAAAALADLPSGRPHAAAEAAVAGGLLLVLAEATSWLRAGRAGTLRARWIGSRRGAWVAGVATTGAALGWGAASLRHDLGDLGAGALALGAVAAVGCVALVAALARAEVSQ